MGGGASTSANYGDKLTIDDIKEICGGVLNESLYDCVKDENNLVDKDKFFKILSDPMEQEILFLYFHFTNSEMNLESFVLFCAHGRLLTKNSFRRKDSEELFARFARNDSINYLQLRFDIFPEIAIKKGIELQALLVKLSRLPPPNYQEKGQSDEKGPVVHSPTTQDRIAKNIAATKIQKIQRTWLAKNDLARERELCSIRSGKHDDMASVASAAATATAEGGEAFVNPHAPLHRERSMSFEWHHHNQKFDETEEEIKCHLFYRKYANENGEMDIKEFVRLCYDTELIPFDSINIDFTGKDAQHIFKKVVNKFFIPEENCYRPGVLYGKRVVYDVFRLRLVPEIAAIKKTGIAEIVAHIAHSPGKVRAGQRANHHKHGHGNGPQIISLLDQKHIDHKLLVNTEHYGEHVE
jgi:hypothetical protein